MAEDAASATTDQREFSKKFSGREEKLKIGKEKNAPREKGMGGEPETGATLFRIAEGWGGPGTGSSKKRKKDKKKRRTSKNLPRETLSKTTGRSLDETHGKGPRHHKASSSEGELKVHNWGGRGYLSEISIDWGERGGGRESGLQPRLGR